MPRASSARPYRRRQHVAKSSRSAIARRPYASGRGRYRIPKGTFAAGGRYLGGAIGASIGNMIAPGVGSSAGSALGSKLGQRAGNYLAKVVGQGDYLVKSNSLVHPDTVVPSFGPDSIRVTKREYIRDINAYQAFTNLALPINPGMAETFPWLSNIANNYDEYRFNGLMFQFVSTSSDAIASTSQLGLGQVILATDYNASDAPFLGAAQMLGSMFANSGKPSENILHAIECDPHDTPSKLFYVRSGDVPTGADVKMYDLGTFQVASFNAPADYPGMGQLWVSYDVTFCKSVQNNQLGLDLNTDSYITVGPVTGSPFGTSRTLRAHSNIGTTVTANQISFPAEISTGFYLINVVCIGDSTACVNPAFTVSNGSYLAVWGNDAAVASSSGGTTCTAFNYMSIVQITGSGCVIQWSGGTLPANGTYGNVVITQVNGEMFY